MNYYDLNMRNFLNTCQKMPVFWMQDADPEEIRNFSCQMDIMSWQLMDQKKCAK